MVINLILSAFVCFIGLHVIPRVIEHRQLVRINNHNQAELESASDHRKEQQLYFKNKVLNGEFSDYKRILDTQTQPPVLEKGHFN